MDTVAVSAGLAGVVTLGAVAVTPYPVNMSGGADFWIATVCLFAITFACIFLLVSVAADRGTFELSQANR